MKVMARRWPPTTAKRLASSIAFWLRAAAARSRSDLVQRHLVAARRIQIGGAGGVEESMIAPGQRQALVAQPDRNGQRIEDGAEIGRGGFDRCGSSSQTAAMEPTARPRATSLRPLASLHRELEGHAAVGQAVQRRGQGQRVRPLQAGLQQLFAAAIGKGPEPSRPQTTSASRPAPRSASRSPSGALRAGAGDAQGAAQALGTALFGQRPERGRDGQATAPAASALSTTRRPVSKPIIRLTGSAAAGRRRQGGPPAAAAKPRASYLLVPVPIGTHA